MRRFYTVTVFMAIMLILTGCEKAIVKKEPEKTIKTDMVQLYFSDPDGKNLKSEVRGIEAGEPELMARKAVDALIAGPLDKELKPLIPKEAKLLKLTVTAGVAAADFSAEFGGGGKDGILKVYSVVMTLCGINGIDKAKLTVDGKPLKSPSGGDLGELTPDEAKNIASSREVEVTLYFLDSRLNLTPEKRRLTLQLNTATENAAVEELIKGPAEKGHIKTIPQGTKLLSLFVKDGVCNINLSGEFVRNRNGSEHADYAAVYSIVKTLTEFDRIKSVRFYIDGKSEDYYGSIELRLPLGRED